MVLRHARRRPLSRRKGTKTKSRRRDKRILVFGEDENDRKSLQELIQALCPGAEGKVERRRDPLVLIKGRPKEAKSEAEKIAAVIRASNVRHEVVCTFLHEDLDGVESGHAKVVQEIEAPFANLNVPGEVHAVVPAYETEAWFFLWPKVFPEVNKNWSLPQSFHGKAVGKIRDAKEVLQRELIKAASKKGKGTKAKAAKQRYQESDAPKIAEKVRERGVANAPKRGLSGSYDHFRDRVARCCEKLAD